MYNKGLKIINKKGKKKNDKIAHSSFGAECKMRFSHLMDN